MTIQKSLITWRLDHYIMLNDTFGEGEYQSNIYIQGGGTGIKKINIGSMMTHSILLCIVKHRASQKFYADLSILFPFPFKRNTN